MRGFVYCATFCLILLLSKVSEVYSVKPSLKRSNARINKKHKSTFELISNTMAHWFNTKVFENANDIPIEYIREKREIKGVVVKVTDGDTFRIRHVANGHSVSEFDGKFTEHSIAIRIAAVDAPELAKQGNAGQEFGAAAKEFTTKALMGKRVTVKLLSKDQYGRVLGLVRYRDNTLLPNFMCSKKDLSEQLLRNGLAVVYRSGGAQYAGSIQRWNAIEQEAISARRGLWKHGAKKADLPSDFKRRSREKKESSKKQAFSQV